MEYKKTRSDLLKLSKDRALVVYSEMILKKKAVLLTSKLLSELIAYKNDLDSTNSMLRKAVNEVDMALSFDGVESVIAASNMIYSFVDVEAGLKNIIGTFVPAFFLKKMEIKRGYSGLTTSFRIDHASRLFESLLRDLIINADAYIRIKKLAEAVFKTKSRYNAIDKKLLPSINKAKGDIEEFLELEEMQENYSIRTAISEDLLF